MGKVVDFMSKQEMIKNIKRIEQMEENFIKLERLVGACLSKIIENNLYNNTIFNVLSEAIPNFDEKAKKALLDIKAENPLKEE